MKTFCFHEIGDQPNPYCVNPKSFVEFAKTHQEDRFHFDDGRKGIYTYWPLILENLAFKPVMFMVPNFLKGLIPEHEKYTDFLNYKDVEFLISQGFELGSHSLTHCDLTKLPEISLKEELIFSKKWLEDRFKVEVTKFSYPYGRINETVKKLAEKTYKHCYSLDSPLGEQRELILAKQNP
ncbi:MAG TPA: polysaccharide deacetylase family protein [Candidatus Pacearchaeota archaeon]|nr:polysaccharide deacetylase family protein [Candidatus Pacearchaeota archaeon]